MSIKFICGPIFLFIMNCSLYAQSKDTLNAKKIIDKGANGDIILGERNKKDQLNDTPVLLGAKESACGKEVGTSKKSRRKQNRKGS